MLIPILLIFFVGNLADSNAPGIVGPWGYSAASHQALELVQNILCLFVSGLHDVQRGKLSLYDRIWLDSSLNLASRYLLLKWA